MLSLWFPQLLSRTNPLYLSSNWFCCLVIRLRIFRDSHSNNDVGSRVPRSRAAFVNQSFTLHSLENKHEANDEIKDAVESLRRRHFANAALFVNSHEPSQWVGKGGHAEDNSVKKFHEKPDFGRRRRRTGNSCRIRNWRANDLSIMFNENYRPPHILESR